MNEFKKKNKATDELMDGQKTRKQNGSDRWIG